MTDHDRTESECTSVLRDVWLFLDDEMDERNRAAVQRHLDACSPCLEQAGLDHKLKQLLAAKCGGDRAPEEFRLRLTTRLKTLAATARESGGAVTVMTETVTVTTIVETDSDARR